MLAPDLQQAHEYWHKLPCDGQLKGVLESPADPSTAAWVNIPGCTIYFNEQTKRLWTAEQLCAIVIHEIGHLLGHHHSRDSHDVMYPVISIFNRPKVCKDNR